MSYIGEREIKTTLETEEITPGGSKIIEVEYQDGLKERFSGLMYEKIVSDDKCSLEELRDRRCQPVVSLLIVALREWGVKASELPYISAMLNRSLEYNRDAALCTLWSSWMPKPLSPDDVDLVTIDRVLKASEGNKG